MALGGLSVYSKDGGWGVSSVVSGIVKGWTCAIDGWLSSCTIDGLVKTPGNCCQSTSRAIRLRAPAAS